MPCLPVSRTILRAYFATVLTISTASHSLANWPQFLGPSRDGASAETGLLSSFHPEGPKVAWRVPGGVGMSAVAVADSRAITMWNDAGKQWLVALNAASGKTLWRTPVGARFKNEEGDGPRATPTITDSQVFAFTGDGLLSKLDVETGKLIWQTNAAGELNAKPADYGLSSSPLVVGDQVVVHVGADNATIAAFHTSTGKLAWTAGRGVAGYASPALLDIDGEKHIVCFTAAGVESLDPASGKLLWRYPFKTPYDCNTANPVAVDGGVFVSAGENHGCVLLDVTKNETGKYQVTERWTSLYTKSVMRNEWQTSVLQGDYLYGFDNVGSAGPTTHLSCIKATTGERVWSKTRFGKGNLVLADGKLWITSMKGELVLVSASPDGYKELGRARLFGRTRQSLSISNGKGYIRDNNEVVCIELK